MTDTSTTILPDSAPSLQSPPRQAIAAATRERRAELERQLNAARLATVRPSADGSRVVALDRYVEVERRLRVVEGRR